MAWVDLQVNGYAGVDFNSAGLTVAAVKTVVDRLAADGTGMFLPTFVTGDSEVVCASSLFAPSSACFVFVSSLLTASIVAFASLS